MITDRGIWAVAAGLLAVAAGTGTAAAAPAWVPGEVLVGVADGVDSAQADRALDRAGGPGERVGAPRARIRRVPALPGETVPQAVARLRALPEVEWAEPNRLVTQDALPNDPFAGEQYWLNNVGQVNGGLVAGAPDADADVLDAWTRTRGSPSVVVAVVDGGIAYDSPDLGPGVYVNPGESGGGRESNGVDDDRNGFVDDWRGWDFEDGDNDPRDLGLFPHGTAVAGIIGARADDGYGIAGVAPRTTILPVRVTSPSGSASIADIVDAFDYAARMGARVVNTSFGGTVASTAERDAMAATPGVLYVASAGNDGDDIDGAAANYPCEFDLPNIICVAATDERDALAPYSNRGVGAVDLAAPGTGMLSTAPPFADLLTEDFETDLAGRWTTGGAGGTWARTTAGALDGAWSLADSPAGPYANNADHFIHGTTPLDLTGRTGCRIDLQYRGDMVNPDGVWFETSTNGTTWVEQDTLTGTTSGAIAGDADISFAQNRAGVRVGMTFRSNGSVTGDGITIDDLVVRCLGGAPDGRDLFYANGTSFAAPVVSGIAALLLAERPSLTVAELRGAILAGVDPLPQLAGAVATGGRASARRALDALPAPAQAAAVDGARITSLGVRRARATGKVTVTASFAGQARGATGLLFREGRLVRRVALAGTTRASAGLGRLPAGAYRLSMAPEGVVTDAVAGGATRAFTVPARRPAPRRARTSHEVPGAESTGAAGYRLPATPQPVSGAGVVAAAGTPPVAITCAAGGCTPAAGSSVAGDPVSAAFATTVTGVADRTGARATRILATGPATRGRGPVTLTPSAQAGLRALALAGPGAATAQLRDLAAAAAAAGTAPLGTGGATAPLAAGARRPALRLPAVGGSGARAAAARMALARYAAVQADVIALSRALGSASARVRAAQARGDLGGVAQGLREATLVAPALGDALAREPGLRRALAAALDGAAVPSVTGRAMRAGVARAAGAMRSARGLTAAESGAIVAGLPAVRAGTALAPGDALRDPGLDRRARALAAALRGLPARL